MFGFMAGVGYSLNWVSILLSNLQLVYEQVVEVETEINQNGITADSDFDLPSTFNLGMGLGIC